MRSISVGVDQLQVKDSLTLLSQSIRPLVCSLQLPPLTHLWVVCLFILLERMRLKMGEIAVINQDFSYKCDSQECDSAEAEMCCFSSAITLWHRVICSGLEGKTCQLCCKLKKSKD